MVDDRALRFRRRTPAGEPPNQTRTDSGGSLDLNQMFSGFLRNQQAIANEAGKGGGTLAADALVRSGVASEGLPVRAAAFAGDMVSDPLNIIGAGLAGAGVRGAARTALGTTARTLKNNPRLSPGVRNVLELQAGRHASPNPNLARELVDPSNVPVSSGRDWGPGFYYEANRPLSSTVPYKDLLARYGDNFYMPKMSPLDMLRLARSRGVADPAADLGVNSIREISSLTMDSPAIQNAMRRGFTGVRGQTSWLVGNPNRVGGLPNLGVRSVTPADDATYPALEALLRRIFE